MDEDGNIKYITIEGKVIIEEVRLREELQKANEALEKRVEERTSELRSANERLVQEITERKHAEEELLGYRAHLEEMVKQRTAELEASNKELEAFAYSVSHDLRAPLRGIDGFSKALLEDCADKLDDEGKHYLNRVRAGSQRMGRLIDDLLTLSKSIRREMKWDRVNLSKLVQQVAAELQESDPERPVEFEIAENQTVRGDIVLLRIVMENLLGNAWKFTRDCRQAEIQFGVEENGGKRQLYVKDNGAGFDMNYAGKLFKPFQRLHSEAEFSGTGIGLANAYRIILRHGGQMWAESEGEGKGAAFYFTM